MTIRLKKFLKNKLLERRQFLISIYHPERGSITKKEIAAEIASKAKCPEECVVVFQVKSKFGGGKSSAAGLIYDNKDALLKFEPRYRKVRTGLAKPRDINAKRRQKKEIKNRMKKFRGKDKAKSAKSAGKKKGK